MPSLFHHRPLSLLLLSLLLMPLSPLLILLIAAAPAQAELYKWVDEQGRTHYSDNASTRPGQQPPTVISLPPDQPDGNTSHGSSSAGAHPLLSVLVHDLPPGKRAIGSYHAGAFCQQAMPMYWPDASAYHNLLTPDSGKITGLLMRALDTLGYPQEASLAPGSPQRLLLTATVADANIRACASDVSKADRFLQPENVLPQEFDRLMIDLTLDWELSTPDGRVIYRNRTSGKSGSLANLRDNYQTWLDVITDATARLHNNSEFQQALSAFGESTTSTPTDDPLALRQSLMRKPEQKPPLIVVTAQPLPETRQQLGVLRAGQFCRNITPLLWPDIRNLRASLAPDTRVMAGSAARSLSNFDYSVQDATAETALAQQRRLNGLLLQMRVTQLYLDACAPDTHEPEKTYGQQSITYSAFNRHQLQLSLDWTLLSPDGKQLFTGQTTTRAGNMQVNSSIDQVYNQSVDQAVMQLLGNPAFQSALNQASPPAAAGTTSDTTSGNGNDSGDGGLLSMLVPKHFKQQAELAGVLAEMSQLKVAMTEYYMSEGQWPTRFEQMQMPPAPMARGAVLLLQPGGVIMARLPASFGDGKELLLRAPDDPTGIGAQWHCETNVEFAPESCKKP